MTSFSRTANASGALPPRARRVGPNSGQRLQSYQSYLQTQYFNHLKPGGNQGGWIDGGRDVECYAEQMWNTFFAKVPEITLFNSMPIMASLNTANRLRDLLTDQTITAAQSGGGGERGFGRGRGNFGGNNGINFDLTVPAHSFRVFQAE
jgi:hypothetical protein